MPTASGADREPDCPAQGREAALGRAQDPGTADQRLDGDIKIPAKSTVENRMDGAAIRQFDRLFKTTGPGHNATPQIKAAQYTANGGVLAKRPQAVLKPKIQFNGVDGWADLRELHGRSSES
jgi:hypothetical protein